MKNLSHLTISGLSDFILDGNKIMAEEISTILSECRIIYEKESN